MLRSTGMNLHLCRTIVVLRHSSPWLHCWHLCLVSLYFKPVLPLRVCYSPSCQSLASAILKYMQFWHRSYSCSLWRLLKICSNVFPPALKPVLSSATGFKWLIIFLSMILLRWLISLIVWKILYPLKLESGMTAVVFTYVATLCFPNSSPMGDWEMVLIVLRLLILLWGYSPSWKTFSMSSHRFFNFFL